MTDGSQTPDRDTPKLAVMAVFHPRENLVFLEEWIAYHLLQGVDHFYLYNNAGSRSAEWGPSLDVHGVNKQRVPAAKALANRSDAEIQTALALLLEPFVAAGRVTPVLWQPVNPVGEIIRNYAGAVEDYRRRFAARTDYTAYIDIDEFLVSTGADTVAARLGTLARAGYDQLPLDEKCFGPRVSYDGELIRPVTGITACHPLIAPASVERMILKTGAPAAPPRRLGPAHPGSGLRVNHYKYHRWEFAPVAERMGLTGAWLNEHDDTLASKKNAIDQLIDRYKTDVVFRPAPPAPAAAAPAPLPPEGAPVELTIGIPVYNDYDAVYFTVKSLQLHQDLSNTELLVIDNFGCDRTRHYLSRIPNARYLRYTDIRGTAAPRNQVFAHAAGAAVLCCDAHVLFAPGAIAKLKAYYRDHPETPDLLQGPLLDDTLRTSYTHLEPVWSAQQWGTWATDPRGIDPENEPFEIGMQSLCVFSCRRSAWPGLNPHFRGFGGEDGYLHAKFRQAGGRVLCLPFLGWAHRFDHTRVAPYWMSPEDRLRNYLIGHAELGLPLQPILDHFALQLPPDRLRHFSETILRHYAGLSPDLS
jgi:hypothetical protein